MPLLTEILSFGYDLARSSAHLPRSPPGGLLALVIICRFPAPLLVYGFPARSLGIRPATAHLLELVAEVSVVFLSKTLKILSASSAKAAATVEKDGL